MDHSVQVEALAYRVHGYAKPRKWDCTVREIAEALDIPMVRVRHVLQVKNWFDRVPHLRERSEQARSASRRNLAALRHAKGYNVTLDEVPLDHLLR